MLSAFEMIPHVSNSNVIFKIEIGFKVIEFLIRAAELSDFRNKDTSDATVSIFFSDSDKT